MPRILTASLVLLLAQAAHADEGMWTYNGFPAAKVKEKYGFEATKDWLDHLRLSSVRLAGGCSASVVSPDGLVMTNHHCARSCIESLSGLQKKDFSRDGFLAKTLADEARCPGFELNRLDEITDVTQRVTDATKGATDAAFADLQKKELSAIEKECGTGDDVRCEVVSLFRGGKYNLYKYRRFQDVRLVMAPEQTIAAFGGFPDNFNFPRFDFDVSFLRIYGADGKPAKMEHWLKWSADGAKDGELVFVSGNPGSTSRGYTVAQFEDERDYRLPAELLRGAELRGRLVGYRARGKEQARHSEPLLLGTENSLKAQLGRREALVDKAFFGQLAKNEADLRAKVKAKPELDKQYGQVWDTIAGLIKKTQELRKDYALEAFRAGGLFAHARALVRYAEESGKPNGERLREFSEARLQQFKQGLLSNKPLYDELEIEQLSFSLSKLRESLGTDHPTVKKVLGTRSPEELATALVKGSRLKDLKTDKTGNATGGYRKELFDGGKAAIDASKDPMIEFARLIDPAAREVRKRYETEVDGPMKKQQELLARARFAVYGDSQYPDATFTLRLSYGSVKGFMESGKEVTPMTTFAGAFDRHTGSFPYALPETWLKAKSTLALETPLNVETTNDVIGGNSGSPLVNAKGEVVGLIFDGNIHSLGGDYGFDEAVNRSTAVHSAGLIEGLEKIYGAKRVVEELKR
jgi:hypothetical protein